MTTTVLDLKSELKTMGVPVPRGTNKAGLEKLLRAHVAERDKETETVETKGAAAASVDDEDAARRVLKLRGIDRQYAGETFQEAAARETREEAAAEIKCRPEVRIARNLFEWGAFWGVPTPVVRVLRGGLTNVRSGVGIDALRRSFPTLEPKRTVYAQIERAIKNEQRMWEYEREYPRRWVHGAYVPTDDLDLFWRLYDLPRAYETPALERLADELAVRDVDALIANSARVDALASSEVRAASAAARAARTKPSSSADTSRQTRAGAAVPPTVWLALSRAVDVEAFLRAALADRLRVCIAHADAAAAD